MNKFNRLITPSRITKLSTCEIFVFGSNLQGHHNGGAAKYAYDHFGAEWGKGYGPQGKSYAIPTMNMRLDEIKKYVDEFKIYAQSHPNNRFLLTRVGCGVAGFTDDEMARLFAEVYPLLNVSIPFEWAPIIIMYAPERIRPQTPPVISNEILLDLCTKYRYEIGAGIRNFIPNIEVRYVIKNNEFGYAYFGDFFFYENKMYVFDVDEKWKDFHQPDVVLHYFQDECYNRGYAHEVLFAGVRTNFKDTEGDYIYTGDVLRVAIQKEVDFEYHLCVSVVGGWTDNPQYAFILDNHFLRLADCAAFTREGTVFFQLDKNQNNVDFISRQSALFWMQGAPDIDDILVMAKFTPNFDQEEWKYGALDILGAEYHWRK